MLYKHVKVCDNMFLINERSDMTNAIATLADAFAQEGFVLEIDSEFKTAMCTKPSKRARMGYTIKFNHYFPTTERMFKFVERELAKIGEMREFKAKRAAEKKEREEAARADVSFGDVFVASWGWEQTQVDAYQVVGKKGSASVVLRPIATAVVSGSEHHMSQSVVPVPNAFISDETITKRVGAYGITLNSYSSAYKWDGARSYHNSWYA